MKQIHSKHQRNIIIFGFTILAAALIGVYVFWSMSTWTTYKTTYEGWQNDLKQSVDTAVKLPVSSQQERVKKLEAFKAASSKITTAQQSLCRTPALITWQHAIEELKQREEACSRTISKAYMLGVKVQATLSYLENEKALSAIMTTAFKAAEPKMTESNWGDQTGIWQNASKAITQMSSADVSFEPIKASALEKTKAVELAWQDIIAAHAAKDKAKYNEAQAKLSTAYGALPTLASESATQVVKLTESLQSAYIQAFDLKV